MAAFGNALYALVPAAQRAGCRGRAQRELAGGHAHQAVDGRALRRAREVLRERRHRPHQGRHWSTCAISTPSRCRIAPRSSAWSSEDNADRAQLYAEIAKASNHPEWEADIKKSFAKRWVATGAKPGWYYQGDDGSWKQK